jgi:hypothetical protein
MSPILDAISSSVAAMPGVATSPAQGTSGTFAATLAAARQGLSTASLSVSLSRTNGRVARVGADANAVTQNLATPPPPKKPLDKPLNHASTVPVIASSAATSVAVPGIPAVQLPVSVGGGSGSLGWMAGSDGPTQTTSHGPGSGNGQATLTPQGNYSSGTFAPTGQVASGGVLPSFTGTSSTEAAVNLPPIPASGASLQDVAPGAKLGSEAAISDGTMAKLFPGFYAASDRLGGEMVANQIGGAGIPQTPATGVTENNLNQNGLKPNGTTQPVNISAAPSQPVSGSVQTDQTAASMSSPILVASASPEVGVPVELSPAPIAQTDQANSAASSVAQANVSTQAALSSGVMSSGIIGSGIVGAQSAASSTLPASVGSPAGKAGSVAAPTLAASVAGVGARGGGRVASASLTLPSGTDSGNAAAIGSQTPFSIFFSGQGAGAESAASTLPKMTLPAKGGALGGNQTTAVGTVANSKSGGAPGGVSQPATGQNTRNATSSSGGPSPQPTARNVESGAAGAQPTVPQAGAAQAGVPQAGAPQAAAPASPAAANPQLAPPTQPALNADALSKAGGLPATAASGAPSAGSQVAQTLGAGALGPVQLAQLLNRVGQTEMRVEMNTSAFGSVQVRTVIHANDVGLVIGSEKGDLRTLLANDMPAITNTLQQQNLRLNSVSYMQGFAFSNNSSGGGDAQQQSFVPMRTPPNPGPAKAAPDDSMASATSANFGSGHSSSLSILA